MFKNAKVKKMFDEDDPKLVFYLDSKGVNLEEIFKDEEDLIEKSIKNHKNVIAETAIIYCEEINRVNKNNQSYLMIAILNDNFSMFKKLLEMEIRLDILDNNRENALFYALRRENRDYFHLLIERNIDIKGQNNNGENTAICAYLNGHSDIAEILILNNIFINHIDKDGNTILHHAFIKYDMEFSLKLIEYGADIFIRNYEGETCFDIASNNGFADVIISKVTELINSLFEDNNNQHLLDLLDEHTEQLNYSEFNIPFLIATFAVKFNNKGIFDKILRNEPLINSLDYRGKSLLMYCIDFGRFVLARKVIYLGVNLNLVDHENKTVLFSVLDQIINPKNNDSIKEEFKLIFKELIDNRIDVNIQDHLGNTVLMNAIQAKQAFIIDKLIEHPFIDLDKVNHQGKTALIIAYEMKEYNIVLKMIHSHKANIDLMDKNNNTLLLLALNDDNYELFCALLQNGASLDLQYKDGLTIMMLALTKQKIRYVAKMFDYHFEIDIQDENGMTALMHAIKIKNAKVVEALLRCGANTKITDNKNDTPILYAIDIEAFEIAKLLRNYEDGKKLE